MARDKLNEQTTNQSKRTDHKLWQEINYHKNVSEQTTNPLNRVLICNLDSELNPLKAIAIFIE